jgi:hypothetical protein
VQADAKLEKAFKAALRAVRKSSSTTGLTNLRDPAKAENVMRSLRWQLSDVNAPWLDRGFTIPYAVIGTKKLKELMQALDIPHTRPPRPGYTMALHRQTVRGHESHPLKIDVMNSGGKCEIQVSGAYHIVFPWLSVEAIRKNLR